MKCDDNINDDKNKKISVYPLHTLIMKRVSEIASPDCIRWVTKDRSTKPTLNMKSPRAFHIMGIIYDEVICRHIEHGVDVLKIKEPFFTTEENHDESL